MAPTLGPDPLLVYPLGARIAPSCKIRLRICLSEHHVVGWLPPFYLAGHQRVAILHANPEKKNIPVIILFHQVGRGRVDTTRLLLGNFATAKTPTLCSDVVSKWGAAATAAVVATVILASAIAPAVPTLVIPLDVPTSVTWRWWRTRDGQVLNWQSLKHGLASLCQLLRLE
jgi:hypothetical protein